MNQKDNLSSHSANQYDTEVSKTIPLYHEIHKQVIDLVKHYNPRPTNWLDTGCGTGTLTDLASKEFSECTFYLSDPSENMLEICKKKLQGKKINILGCIPTVEISSQPESFEIVSAIQCHHYLNNEERYMSIKKCYSLLKTNGIFITTENYRPQNEISIRIGLDRWVDFQLSSGKSQEDALKHRKRFDHEFFPITINEHLDVLGKANFKVVELFWLSYMQAGFFAIK